MHAPKRGKQFSFLRGIRCQYLCSKIIIAEKNNETAGKINQIPRGQPEIEIPQNILVTNIAQELVKIHQHKKYDGGRHQAIAHGIKQLVVLQHNIFYQQVKNNNAGKQGNGPHLCPCQKKLPEIKSQKNNGEKGMDVIQPDVGGAGVFHHDAGSQHHHKGEKTIGQQGGNKFFFIPPCIQPEGYQVNEIAGWFQIVIDEAVEGHFGTLN